MQLVQLLKVKYRLILAFLVDVLFISNYGICELFYKNEIYKWWGLKQNIYNVIIAIVFVLAGTKKESENNKVSFLINVGIGFCVSNCVDRIFFDVNYFTKEDIYMIIITLISSYIKVYIKKVKKSYSYWNSKLITIGIEIYNYVRRER